MIWEQWTEPALETVARARNEARRLGDSQVCTEHLLLGLLGEDKPDLLVARLLEHFSISTETLRQDIDRNVQSGSAASSENVSLEEKPELPPLQLAMRSIHVADMAENEAYHTGKTLVHPVHVLLALIREGDGLAGRILLNLGASQTDETRQLVCQWVSGEGHNNNV